jgi:hypothetical protein
MRLANELAKLSDLAESRGWVSARTRIILYLVSCSAGQAAASGRGKGTF